MYKGLLIAFVIAGCAVGVGVRVDPPKAVAQEDPRYEYIEEMALTIKREAEEVAIMARLVSRGTLKPGRLIREMADIDSAMVILKRTLRDLRDRP